MKTIHKTSLILLASTVLLAAFGMVKYPNAPITHNELGYFDTRFNSYTEEDYRNFKIWESSLLLAGIATSVGAVCCFLARK
jgi:hypothetical protein